MHPSALENCRLFFESYSDYFRANQSTRVLEIGSQDVNGSLKQLCPQHFQYIGVDFVPGKNVDVVLDDPYKLPFEDNTFDIILSSSCFEHSQMFWLLFLEISRVLSNQGLFYLNAPSNGMFHRYPVDCWRFYPDSGEALALWAKREGFNIKLLESFISQQDGGSSAEYHWSDFVAVFTKYDVNPKSYERGILSRKQTFFNAKRDGTSEFLNKTAMTEDFWKLHSIKTIIDTGEGEALGGSAEEKLSLIKQLINNDLKMIA